MITYYLNEISKKDGYFLISDMENDDSDQCVVINVNTEGIGFTVPFFLKRSDLSLLLEEMRQVYLGYSHHFEIVFNEELEIKCEVRGKDILFNVIINCKNMKGSININTDMDAAEEFLEPNMCMEPTIPDVNDDTLSFHIVEDPIDSPPFVYLCLTFRNSMFDIILHRELYYEPNIPSLYKVLDDLLENQTSGTVSLQGEDYGFEYENGRILLKGDVRGWIFEEQSESMLSFTAYVNDEDVRKAREFLYSMLDHTKTSFYQA